MMGIPLPAKIPVPTKKSVRAVINPRRMPYDRLITMVDSFSRFLTDSLAARAQGKAVHEAGDHTEKMEDSDE